MIHNNADDALAAQQAVADRFSARFGLHLARMAVNLRSVGHEVTRQGELDSDEDWAWELEIDGKLSITYEVRRACCHELPWTEAEHDDGVNLGLRGVGEGGNIVIDAQPGNFTNKVWVGCENWKELERRFRLITSSEAHELVFEEATEYLEG